MSYRLNNDWRGNRNYKLGSFPPEFGTMHYSIASYCTDKSPDGLSKESNTKCDLNETLTSETCLAQLQRLSNPLQKNLANTLPNIKADNPKNMTANYRHSRQKSFDFHVQDTKASSPEDRRAEYSTFSGIGSFISNVFNVITQAIPFQRRHRDSSIVNLDETEASRDSSPPLVTWPKSNLDIQNKNKTQSQTHNHTIKINDEFDTKMNKECLSAASQCEGKLATVRLLLANKVAATKPVPVKPRRPRRIFVPPNSVDKVFEDAFTFEECEHMSNSHDLEHLSPSKNVVQHFVKLNAPKVNIQAALDIKDVNVPAQCNQESIKPISCDTEVVNEGSNQDINSKMTINEVACPKILISDEDSTEIASSTDNLPLALTFDSLLPSLEKRDGFLPNANETDNLIPKSEETNVKSEVVASCEDKVNRLKAILLERKLGVKSTKHTEKESSTETYNHNERGKQHKKHSKKHKNPKKTTDKRQKCYQNMIIKDDMSFAKELDTEVSSSLDNSSSPDAVNKQLCGNNDTLETKVSKTLINCDIVKNLSETAVIQDSPVDCIFDEVSGRFRNSSTTESEDSFQIVFTDNLQPTLSTRKLSDCDSEDSFIVFEDSPDSCYTSTDIFGNSDEETETSSSDCDSDSGNELSKLNHAFSRTVSDLTDTNLYEPGGFTERSVCLDSEDEVDSAVKLAEEIQSHLIEDSAYLIKGSSLIENTATLVAGDSEHVVGDSAALFEDSVGLATDSVGLATDSVGLAMDSVGLAKDSVDLATDSADLATDSVDLAKDSVDLATDSVGLVTDSVGLLEESGAVCDDEVLPEKSGVLLTAEKKLQKRLAGPRKVRFSEAPPKVHVMRVWQFAARQARAGHWDRYALDRERFQRRIADVDMAISWVLKPQHRARVKFQRFMPWWHAQRRKEAADKKLREEQEKIQKEQEKIQREEQEKIRVEEEERMQAEELRRIENNVNVSAEVGNDGTPHNDSISDKPVNDSDIDKKDLLIITNKCLLNVDSINEIKMQISNEVKQLLASSDDEFKSSSSDIVKRKKKDKNLNKKKATVLSNKNGKNDNSKATVVANCQTNC